MNFTFTRICSKMKLQVLFPVLAGLMVIAQLPAFAQSGTNPASCDNIDFSRRDFTNWIGKTTVYKPDSKDASNCNPANMKTITCKGVTCQSCNGCYSGTGANCVPAGNYVPYYLNTGIVNGRHTIITQSVPDPYACNNINTLPPGEQVCARLGNGGIGPWGNGVGYQIDYLQYSFVVGTDNSLLTYKYAIILQDPLRDPNNPPHTDSIRPRFNVFIRDQTGNLIDPTCGKFQVIYDTTISGFRECPYQDVVNLGGNPSASVGTAYRAWTTVGVDLRKYIGQKITIEFNTWDCGWGGHFGYAYITARCDSVGIGIKGCNQDGSVTLTAPPGFAYKWLPNGESTQSITAKNVKPGDKFKVVLTTSSGCVTDVETTVYPSVVKANFNAAPVPVCLGQTINFTDSSYSYSTGDNAKLPIIKWEWDFGDGTKGANANVSHIYTKAGVYRVKLIVTNIQNCIDTISKLVSVFPAPVADFSTKDVCVSNPTQFTDLSTSDAGKITSWNWNFGDGQTSTEQNPKHIYATTGTFTVSLNIMSENGCRRDTTHTVSVWPQPIAKGAADTVCEGDTTAFTDLSAVSTGNDQIASWVWNFGDGSSLSSGQHPRHYYMKAGTYKITLIVTTSRGCVDDAEFFVTVNPRPKADFEARPICLGAPIPFTDLSTLSLGVITSWKWNFGDGSPQDNTKNPSHIYANKGFYNVTHVVASSFGCVDSITKPIDIPELPKVDFSDPHEGCAPLEAQFRDLTFSPYDSVVTWQWDFGDGTGSSDQHPLHVYKVPGVYSVTLTVITKNGCKQVYTRPDIIKVYPTPVSDFTFTPNSTTENSPTIAFIDKSTGANQWQWTLGDGNISTKQNPYHTYTTTGTFKVWQLVRNQYGCIHSSSKEVVIIPEWSFYIPNTFTPNGDGKNDFFIGSGYNIIEHQMWIFDRWGNLIYTTGETKNPESAVPWDGKANDGARVAQIDTYVWLVILKDIFGQRHRYIGHVNLVR